MKRKLQRVLVADDNRIVRAVLRELFEGLGAEVVEAADGDAALELAQESGPQLIFMDLLMPKRDGFEVADEILRFGLPSRPVLFLATAVYKGARWEQECIKTYKASEFLRKPIDHDDLLNRLDKYFTYDASILDD
jgi:CheY-like chemotaxis protein